MKKQLITFKIQDGEREYFDYGIYPSNWKGKKLCQDHFGLKKIKRLDKGVECFWDDFMESSFEVYNTQDITEKEIKVLKNFGIAY